MIDITVKVPEERVGEFYSMFGTWLSGSPPGLPTPGTKTVEGDRDALQPWSDADTELAAEVWGKLSAPAKRLFSTLIDNPGSRFNGETLGEMLELPNGKHSVAGLLGWPGATATRSTGNGCGLLTTPMGNWRTTGSPRRTRRCFVRFGIAKAKEMPIATCPLGEMVLSARRRGR